MRFTEEKDYCDGVLWEYQVMGIYIIWFGESCIVISFPEINLTNDIVQMSFPCIKAGVGFSFFRTWMFLIFTLILHLFVNNVLQVKQQLLAKLCLVSIIVFVGHIVMDSFGVCVSQFFNQISTASRILHGNFVWLICKHHPTN